MAWFDENAPTDYQSPAIAGGGYTGMGGTFGVTDPKVKAFDTTTTTTTPTPTTTTPTATTGPGPVNGDWQTWFNTLTAGKPPTPDQLAGLESAINAAGGKVLRNAAGVAGKIQLPNGQIIDVIQSAGTGGKAWQWLTGDASGGAADGGSLGRLGQGFGGYLDPFTGEFHAPNLAELEGTPGYQFARDQGLQAIDRSAAAKGTLLTGGTLKDLAGFAGGIASQNYNNVFAQGLDTFKTNRDTFYHNQDSPFSKLYQVSALGRPTTP